MKYLALTISLLSLQSYAQEPNDYQRAQNSLAAAQKSIQTILALGTNCSIYFVDEKLSGIFVPKELKGKTLKDGVFNPLQKNLKALETALDKNACESLPETVSDGQASVKNDYSNILEADGYLKNAFTKERKMIAGSDRYEKCTSPKNPSDPHSNVEGLAYQSLKSSMASAKSALENLQRENATGLCQLRDAIKGQSTKAK